MDFLSIFAADIRKECRYSHSLSFCVDIGDPKYVAGKREINLLLAILGNNRRQTPSSSNGFRFRDDTLESLGKIHLPLETPKGAPFVLVDLGIVQVDVPALLVMDILEGEERVADKVALSIAHHAAYDVEDGRKVYVDV